MSTNPRCVDNQQVNNGWLELNEALTAIEVTLSFVCREKSIKAQRASVSAVFFFFLTHPNPHPHCTPTVSTSKVILLPGRIFSVGHCLLYDWQAHYPIPITILPNQSIHCILLEAEKGNLLHENIPGQRRRDFKSGWVLGFILRLSKEAPFTGELININVKMSSV